MSNKTIMVVDDVESNRVLLKMILEDDFNIVECSSGQECLDKVTEQAPDIILLDVNMPGMTGYEVCTELRKHKESSVIPIIFVSAMDNVEERLAGFEAVVTNILPSLSTLKGCWNESITLSTTKPKPIKLKKTLTTQ